MRKILHGNYVLNCCQETEKFIRIFVFVIVILSGAYFSMGLLSDA